MSNILDLAGNSAFMDLWPHILAPVVFVFLFTLPPFPLRPEVYLVTFTWFFLRCFEPNSTFNFAGSQYLATALALVWMHYLSFLAKMFLHQPEHDFWRVGHRVHEADHMKFGLEKLIWASALLTSPRGVGWNFRISNLPSQGRLVGKWRFIIGQALRVTMFAYLSAFLSELLSRKVSSQEGLWKVILGPLVAMKIWSNMEMEYACLNTSFVVLGIAEEEDCLPLIGGDVGGLDSLQEFWDQFWLQNFRIMFQDYGNFVCWYLGIRRHSRLSHIIQVWVGFLISAGIYAWAMSKADSLTGFNGISLFFILQALGVTIEVFFFDTPIRDLILYEFGLQEEVIMGRVWTFGWLVFSCYCSITLSSAN